MKDVGLRESIATRAAGHSGLLLLVPRTGVKKSTLRADIVAFPQEIDGNRTGTTTKIFFKFAAAPSDSRIFVQCVYVFFPKVPYQQSKTGTRGWI
jgi:hypothetical protein